MAQLDHARKLEIAERLRGLREKDPAIKQPHVAEATRVSLRTAQAWEAGAATPKWEHAEALAKFYGVDVDWLMGRTEAEKHGPAPAYPGGSQLDRIEQRLDRVEEKVDRLLDAAATPPTVDAAELRAALEAAAQRADEGREKPPAARRRKGRKGRAA